MEIPNFKGKKEAVEWIQNSLKNECKPYKIKISNKKHYELICPSESCNFIFKCVKKTTNFIVKAFISHTCDNNCTYLTSSRISNVIAPLLIDTGDCLKPKNYMTHLKNQFGIDTSYMNAYRALKSNKFNNLALEARKCRLLFSWLEWMTNNNPGSVFDYQEKLAEEPSFASKIEYCFLCRALRSMFFQILFQLLL